MPKAVIPTSETGTRHRTAERVARSIDVPVLSVSAAMSVIAVYRNDLKHTIQPIGWLHDRTDQALATMQRFRNRFDVALNGLSILEVEDTVSVGDVVGVVQAAEMVLRIAEEVDGYLVELGDDGRLVGLQSAELVDGVAPALHLVVRDYCGRLPRSRAPTGVTVVDQVVEQLAHLASDELQDASGWPRSSGCPASFHDAESGVEPRGYRLLYRLPRFSDAIIERIVDRFVNLQQIMRASLGELEQVEGVGRGQGPLGEGRPGPPGRGQHLRALPVADAAGTSGPAAAWDRGGGRGREPCRHRVSWRARLRGPDELTSPGSARNARRNGVRHR